MAGWGWALAAQEMQRLDRQMRMQREDRAARRRMHSANMAQQEGVEDDHPTRVDFDCYHMCGNCGFLQRGNQGSCPSCDTSGWLDLAEHTTADLVRDMDEEARQQTPAWVFAAMAVVALASAVVVFFLTSNSVAAALATCVVVGAVLGIVRKPITALMLRPTTAKPARWRLPVPGEGSEDGDADSFTGVATAADETLVAPFSARPCLAYQASVLFDAAHDARPPQWVLLEAAGTTFTVGERAVDGTMVMVKAPQVAIDPGALEASGVDPRRFLRERGLFATDGAFEFFEAVLEPGEHVSVQDPGAGQPISVDVGGTV
jgi:hypothetical protein